MTKAIFVTAWILAEINCFIWRKRAKDAEQNLVHYRIAIKGLLNKMHELNKRRGADDDIH